MRKTCVRCGEAKEATAFYANPNTRDGLDSRCKLCARAYIAEWQAQRTATRRAERAVREADELCVLVAASPIPAGTVPVPLRAKNGTLRAFALVDSADADLVFAMRWHLNGSGYAVTNVKMAPRRYTTQQLGRVLLGLAPGDALQADHINGDPLDNRRANLRAISADANAQNKSGRTRGVYQRGRSWVAQVKVDGKLHRLGTFETENAAVEAASAFRAKHMPFSRDALAA